MCERHCSLTSNGKEVAWYAPRRMPEVDSGALGETPSSLPYLLPGTAAWAGLVYTRNRFKSTMAIHHQAVPGNAARQPILKIGTGRRYRRRMGKVVERASTR